MPDSSSSGKSGLFRRLLGGGPEKAKTARLPIHAYGKLPIYKDFISSGMTDAPAQEFRGWVDKGFSHRWSTDEGCQDTEIPPHSFLFRMPGSKGYAAGSIWGSSDEGGLRKFPFALFFSFPKDHAAADPVTAVEYLGEVERRASELRFLFGPGASLSSFYQSYRGAELELALRTREQVGREFRSELSAFSVGDLAESLFGDDAARAWPALLDAASAGVAEPGAIRLPLGGRLPRAREVEFWLLWFERQDPRGRRPVTGVLYPHGHNPGRATFFFRDLRPEDFLLLHSTRRDLPQVHEPGGSALSAAPGARPPERSAGEAPAQSQPVPPNFTDQVAISTDPGARPPERSAGEAPAQSQRVPRNFTDQVAIPTDPGARPPERSAGEAPAQSQPVPRNFTDQVAISTDPGARPPERSAGEAPAQSQRVPRNFTDQVAIPTDPGARPPERSAAEAPAQSQPVKPESPSEIETIVPAAEPAARSTPGLSAPLEPPLTPQVEAREEAPFPEANLVSEPTSSGRLSQILALDSPASAAPEAPEALEAGPTSSTPVEPPSLRPPEPIAPPAPVEAESAAPAGPAAAAPAPAVLPEPPAVPAPVAPVAPGVPPAAPPAGWERPLGALFEP